MKNVRHVGARVQRREDARLSRGEGCFTADVPMPSDTLHAVFLRSPYAHAGIAAVDTATAQTREGVECVLYGEDLAPLVRPLRATMGIPTFVPNDQWPLAREKVRFDGEAVAVVVAASPGVAEDALEDIDVRYIPLTVCVDAQEAMEEGAPVLHESAPDNVMVRLQFEFGESSADFSGADLVVRECFEHARIASAPMETRGCMAQWDSEGQCLTVHSSTQLPHMLRDTLAELLDLPADNLRVIAPDVGGAFGGKACIYPEEIVVACLARELGRPVRWIEDRDEHLRTSVHGREEVHHVEMALSREGHILGIRNRVIGDVGAYASYPWTGALELVIGSRMLPAPYKVPYMHYSAVGVMTNKAPLGMVRGVAQPITTMVMEGLMDRAARELGMDPAELRIRNMISEEELPYQSLTNLQFDSGSFIPALRKALERINYPEVRQQQKTPRPDGCLRGVGMACFVEASASSSRFFERLGIDAAGGDETARVVISPDGRIAAYVGINSHGQGHETMLSQIVADGLGISIDAVSVYLGDTGLVPQGRGAWASRSAVVAGAATRQAVARLRQKVLAIAAHLLSVDPDELSLEEAHARVVRYPDCQVSLFEIARAAKTPDCLPADMDTELDVTQVYEPPPVTFSNSSHVAIVDVDSETGQLDIVRYVVVEDCGEMINPGIVEGQLHGGAVHGLSNALFESLEYDDNGQLLTNSFISYRLPSARELPDIEVEHIVTPSPSTEGGVKGMGESGTMAPAAAILNAVSDALAPLGVPPLSQVPATPERIWRAIHRRMKPE